MTLCIPYAGTQSETTNKNNTNTLARGILHHSFASSHTKGKWKTQGGNYLHWVDVIGVENYSEEKVLVMQRNDCCVMRRVCCKIVWLEEQTQINSLEHTEMIFELAIKQNWRRQLTIILNILNWVRIRTKMNTLVRLPYFSKLQNQRPSKGSF